jgi:ABC-2 type transport system permease protein
MNLMTKLVAVELKLLTRDLGTVSFGVAFPAVLLLVLGLIPGFQDPDPDLGGASLIELYTPIVLILTFAMVGISALGVFLATYRDTGVLRRLRVTPIGPSRLLIAQLVAHLALALVGSAIAVIAAMLAFGVEGPSNWPAFALALTLAAAAIFTLGLLLGALAPSPSAAGALGPLVWLPLMVLAGLWFPREAMPDTMRTISDFSPGGAAVDAIRGAWFSGTMELSSLAVLAASVVIVGGGAAATFRWE